MLVRLAMSMVLVSACSGGTPHEGPPVDAGPRADVPGRDGGRLPDGAPRPVDGALPGVGVCRVERRFVVHSAETDSYVQRIAVRGREVGVLFIQESPRATHLGRFDLDAEVPRVADIAVLGELSVIQDTGLVATGDGFVAAWRASAED